jgi:hypothetical protein
MRGSPGSQTSKSTSISGPFARPAKPSGVITTRDIPRDEIDLQAIEAERTCSRPAATYNEAMTFEEALAVPGRKAQASGEVEDGKRRLMIYSLASGAAKQLTAALLPEAEHDALVADFRARGCEVAETEFLTRVLWIRNTDGIEVFDKRRKLFEAAGDRATLVNGRVIERSDIARVFSWASDDYAHRGIKAALRSGEEVELTTEISLAATGDPSYNRNDLLFDSGWCTTLGVAIANWAGTTYENKI